MVLLKKILTKKNLIRLAVFLGFLIPSVVMFAMAGALSRELDSQTFAARFDKSGKYAHISAFVAEEAAIKPDSMPMVRYFFTKAIENGGIDEEENAGRAYMVGYSTPIGDINIRSVRATATASATAVGGDFFMFHPYKLLDGNYFDSNDLNGDGVILDADTAWTLFGSSHVAGMQVEINGVVYPVRGVIKRDTGMFAKESGEEDSMVFVSYEVANGQPTGDYFSSNFGITCMELLMKNPVKHFAYDVMQNTLKDSMFLTEDSYELVENSTRFNLLPELKVVTSLGKRSMKKNPIVYPGWENRARGYEGVIGTLKTVGLLLLIYPIIIAAIYMVRLIIYLIGKIKKLIGSIRKKAAEKYQQKWLKRQENV